MVATDRSQTAGRAERSNLARGNAVFTIRHSRAGLTNRSPLKPTVQRVFMFGVMRNLPSEVSGLLAVEASFEEEKGGDHRGAEERTAAAEFGGHGFAPGEVAGR
jgi:hypothetical protein